MTDFDVIVIGTGVSGQTAAAELAEAGKRVAVVDEREFGGTCALRGCEPKKVLFSAAEVVERAAGQLGNGPAGSLRLEWPSLIAFKRTFTDTASASIEQSLISSGATPIHGTARFVAADAIEVDGTRYSAAHFVIATGARPMPLRIPGAELVIDSEQFLAAEALGASIVFIGGGHISFEFAHIAAATGAHATILSRGTPLGPFDPDLVSMLVRAYRADGIEVRESAPVVGVRASDGRFVTDLADGSTVDSGMVVHGAGRAPDLERLDLEAAGIAYGRSGIEVDSSMRSTTNHAVFAAGDAVASGPPLTPVGIRQARVALANILEPGSATFDSAVIPSAVFSNPPLASVGLSESAARAAGLDVVVKLSDMTEWASERRTGSSVSGAKTIVERGTGRIVGAHFLGHGAEEVVNVIATAMRGGLTASDMTSAIWAYPTQTSNLVYLF